MGWTDAEGRIHADEDDNEQTKRGLLEVGKRIKDDDEFESWAERLASDSKYNTTYTENAFLNGKLVGERALEDERHDIGMSKDVASLRDFVAKSRGWSKAKTNAWVKRSLSRKEDE